MKSMGAVVSKGHLPGFLPITVMPFDLISSGNWSIDSNRAILFQDIPSWPPKQLPITPASSLASVLDLSQTISDFGWWSLSKASLHLAPLKNSHRSIEFTCNRRLASAASFSAFAARIRASFATIFNFVFSASRNDSSLADVSKIPASPSISPTTPITTAALANLYKVDRFQLTESGHSPIIPMTRTREAMSNSISDAPSQDLALASDNEERKSTVFAFHVAALVNLASALAIIVFFVTRCFWSILKRGVVGTYHKVKSGIIAPWRGRVARVASGVG
jgi:hypothetical protein